MGFFSNTFQKVFVGTKATTANGNQTTGFITTSAISTSALQTNTGVAATTYGPGSYGFFDAKTWLSVTTASITTTAPNLVLASASLHTADKIGPFHGGYMESNKSKEINPKLVTSWTKISPCTARQHTLHIGDTKYTKTLSPTQSACQMDFLCGENYNLRVEVRNDPALRFLQRAIYRILSYDTGCCADGAPGAAIDGTLVMIAWAQQIVDFAELKDFILPIVYSEAGVAHYPPGTVGEYTWDNYVSPGHTNGKYAGLRLQGAYVDTVFGNCSFQVTDYFNKTPVQLLAQVVDFSGEPCVTGLCVNSECLPLAGNGFGETLVRETILSQLYLQNKFSQDVRLREIEQADKIFDVLTRSSQYTVYILQHKIPRNFGPGAAYSEEVYDNWIITNGTVASLETLVSTWLDNAGSTVTLETISCGSCSPLTP
jgi:hypothetical protein